MSEQLEIRTEFQNLIPPLSLEELNGLEDSIKKEGCRDPLVVWNNTIIDGHHRYAICTKHNIPFNTRDVQGLDTDIDVKLWMINNQFSRRNLPTETRLALAYRFKEFEAEKAKERKLAGVKIDIVEEDTVNLSAPVHTGEEKIKGRTLEAIAKMAGVSARTADQYDKIQQQGTEEQKEEVATGNSSIKKVYTQIQKAKQPQKNKTSYWVKGKFTTVVQQHITSIYNLLADHKDLIDINYWLGHSSLGDNENFLAPVYKIHNQKILVTKNLNQLSESVDDLEILANQCKNLVLIEAKKDKKFAKQYERYYAT